MVVKYAKVDECGLEPMIETVKVRFTEREWERLDRWFRISYIEMKDAQKIQQPRLYSVTYDCDFDGTTAIKGMFGERDKLAWIVYRLDGDGAKMMKYLTEVLDEELNDENM